MNDFSFFATGLQVFAAAEAARRFEALAAQVEGPVAALRDRAAELTREGEEWRQVAADPANRRDVALIEESLGISSNFSRDASALRREAARLESQARRLRGRAAEFTREAKQANRAYSAMVEAEKAEAYRLANEIAAAERRRKADAARARRQRREERQARENVAALFAQKAAAANAVAL